MIRTSPFHKRTSALNETGLWSHWSGHLAAHRYQLSDKFEYFAVRNAAGVFDSSPLYKYRIHGPRRRARSWPASSPATSGRAPPGNAQYTAWCDDRGFVVEDGVILRPAADEFLLTAAEPNLAYFEDLIGRRHEVAIEEVSDDYRHPRRPGPALARPARGARPRAWRRSRSSASTTGSIAGVAGDRVADRLQRRPRLRDLGPQQGRAQGLGRAVGLDRRATASCRSGSTRCTCSASRPACSSSMSTSLEPLRLDRRGPLDADRARLGLDVPRPGRPTTGAFIGRRAIEREIADKTSRWRLTGLIVDWARLRPDLRRGRA